MRASGTLLVAIAFCVALGVAIPDGAPQEGRPVPKREAQKIALLDLNYLYRNSVQVRADKGKIAEDVARAEADVKKEKEEIRAMQTLIEGFKKGSRDYEESEKQIAERIANLNVTIAVQRKKFMQQEAESYYKTYRAIEEELRRYVADNHIALVFKFDSAPCEPDNPDSVVHLLNRPVIYWEDGMDITAAILERVNRKAE